MDANGKLELVGVVMWWHGLWMAKVLLEVVGKAVIMSGCRLLWWSRQ